MTAPHPRSGPPITVDTAALYLLIDAARESRELIWTEVADETGVDINVFRRIRLGTAPRLPAYLTLVRWADPTTGVLPCTIGDLPPREDHTTP
jgi:hypothetical protein